MSKELADYVIKHAVRGACQCGRCSDAPAAPEAQQPDGHTINLTFFEVAQSGADGEVMKALVERDFPEWLDGEEHGYMELGGQLGDQGLALMTIGLGHLVGLWKAHTPDTLMPEMESDLKQQLAGSGMVTLQVER